MKYIKIDTGLDPALFNKTNKLLQVNKNIEVDAKMLPWRWQNYPAQRIIQMQDKLSTLKKRFNQMIPKMFLYIIF